MNKLPDSVKLFVQPCPHCGEVHRITFARLPRRMRFRHGVWRFNYTGRCFRSHRLGACFE
jgi:hypothetical protein